MRALASLLVLFSLVPRAARAQVAAVATGETIAETQEGARAVAPDGSPLEEGEPAVSVQVRVSRPGEQLHLITGYDRSFGVIPLSTGPVTVATATPRLTQLCTGDCSLTLRIGARYRFQVPPPAGVRYGIRGLSDNATVTITERTIGLDVTHNMRPPARRRSWITLASMVAIGGILIGVGVARADAWCGSEGCDGMHVHAPIFWTGVGLASFPVCLLSLPLLMRSRTEVRLIESGQ